LGSGNFTETFQFSADKKMPRSFHCGAFLITLKRSGVGVIKRPKPWLPLRL
jgi:hypothetical protein